MTMTFICFLASLLLGVVASSYGVSEPGSVFHVQHKFAAHQHSLNTMKDHDIHRRQRFLYSVDIPLGGDGNPTGTGLYFTKLKIGSPSNDYYFNVDTGSDLFWVNCVGCNQCPKKSGLGMDLMLYDPSKSSTSQIINCDNDFCIALGGGGPIPGCTPDLQCVYQQSYGDGSTTAGYFVRDIVEFDRVTGNRQTTPANSSIILGCGVEQSGKLVHPDMALDGVLGLGQSETSLLSQIAASGSIKKMFAHCLDGKNGGGIFAMGNIVQPKVTTTPLLADKTHYNVNLDKILAGEQPLPLPGTSSGVETIIDSGTTLAYVPEAIYTPLIKKIMENHGNLAVKTVETFQCFEYKSSLDTDFPEITLKFNGSLQLVVYPHDYLLPYKGLYCIGWQSSRTLDGLQHLILLGDMVLSNKLVLYDVENMAIGWTEYNWFLVSLLLGVIVSNYGVSATGGVFHVQHKFAAQQRSLSAMKEHDIHRRQRFLYSVDIPLGGDGKPTGTGLYFTKLKVGSPSNDYYVNVDTGSDIFWVNCIECSQCQKKSGLGVDLTLYDPSKSSTSQIINCDNDFCTSVSNSPVPGCAPGLHCEYQLSYGDGSTTAGYFVKDIVQYDRVSGNRETTPANSSIVLGCGVQQTGKFQDSDMALDGILGFGQSATSLLSQIAASGSVKKMFAHCLDGKNGGGIFAIGNIVEPKVTTTPLLPNKYAICFTTSSRTTSPITCHFCRMHYNVNLEGILVGEQPLQLPVGTTGTSSEKETIIDSGTTLAYVPDDIYTPLVNKIMENHGDLTVNTVQDTFQCFEYHSSLDTDFPKVTLNFGGSLQLVVYPHDYLFPYQGAYCIGWQSSGTQASGVHDVILLGDLVLSNKLVLYDVENMAIGWTAYDCSTTIKVQDEQSNTIYEVQAHKMSSAHSQDLRIITLLLLVCAIFIL